jgi:hypothetical protein
MRGGYAWLDTLVHELTHLALTQATADKAPLWLQEGVAKREEVRWRRPDRFDALPSADSVAAYGLQHGLGRPIDRLGPSIALLPSAEEAQVAYAEVESFLGYWLAQNGEEALPQLLLRIKASERGGADEVAQAIEDTSGSDFHTWDLRWRQALEGKEAELEPEHAPGARVPHAAKVSERLRLGDLLGERGHHAAASKELAEAQRLLPRQAVLRSALGASLLAEGRAEEARALVSSLEEVVEKQGRYLSLHAHLAAPPDADEVAQAALAVQPLEPAVACQELQPPALPSDPQRAALCELARRLGSP